MQCKNCQTELTQMKNDKDEPTCLRCLKCHPMPTGAPVIKAKKDNVKVDEPWTDERILKLVEPKIREMFIDLIEDYVIAQSKAEDPELIPEKVELTWQEQAKALGVNPYGRKKEIVLAEIAELTKGPDKPGDNENSQE